jgi:hypothetical protein
VPRHIHAWLYIRDQFAAAVDALHIEGVEEAVARVPAELLDAILK